MSLRPACGSCGVRAATIPIRGRESGGYVESFTSWRYAKDAFDKWAALFARRFAALRGLKSAS